LQIAIELLNHQFGDIQSISDFLKTLYNVVEQKLLKLNSICVVTPPSAGKTYFFDAVAAYFLSYGMLNTATWNDVIGKRLVLWNGAMSGQRHLKKIKELLGGDTTHIQVKNKIVTLQRVPIIVLTNDEISIINHPEFADRLRTYRWVAAPFLKNHNKKLNLLCFYKLLEHYNIL